MRRAWVAAIFGASIALTVHAQAPDLAGPGGSVETVRLEHELDEYPLPVARFGGPAPTVLLTGAVSWTAWRVPAEGRTVTSVMQDYRRTLSERGFRIVLDCSGQDCGGFDFRFEAALLPPPAMAMDVQDFAQLSAERANPVSYASVLVSQVRGSIFVQIVTVVPQDPGFSLPGQETAAGKARRPDSTPAPESAGGVAAPPDPVPPERGQAGDDSGRPLADATTDGAAVPSPPDGSEAGTIEDDDDPPEAADAAATPDEAATDSTGRGAAPAADGADAVTNDHLAMAAPGPGAADMAAPGPAAGSPAPESAGEEPADGAPLLDSLVRFGHVPVEGLAFESGGAALTEGSGPALDRLAAMLIGNPALRIAIVGHSDNQGPLDVNIAISKKRAEAVRQALIARGVAGERLEASGVGYLAPRRSNQTEGGRALNRRVELVLRAAQ